MIAHDGDDPDAKPAAAQAYHRGVVRYLGQGLTLRMTAPPTGCDPNDVLKLGGPDALKKLLTEARCDLGKFDDAAFLNEVCQARRSRLRSRPRDGPETARPQQARNPGQGARPRPANAGPRRREAQKSRRSPTTISPGSNR